MKLKRISIVMLSALFSLSVFGCSISNSEYDDYHKEVNNLYEQIVSTDVKINNLDVESESSINEMFESMDSLKTSFEEFSKVDTPKEFSDCIYLSEEAARYIEDAQNDFHKALDDEYDDISFKSGISNYNEVIKCVNYMGDVLQNK